MMRWARRLLRRSSLPKQYRSLPSADITRTPWNVVGRLNDADVARVTRGEWRELPEVTPMLDEADPDADYAPTAPFRNVEELVATATDEDASIAAREGEQPLLQLAQQFHAEVAASADDEMDPGSDAERLSDHERRTQALEVQRAMFASFYATQRLVGISRERFIASMATPPTTLVAAAPRVPLVRLCADFQLRVLASRNARGGGGDGRKGAPAALRALLGREDACVVALHDDHHVADVAALRWLQRGIASGALVEADVFAMLLPILLDVRPGEIVLDTTPAADRRRHISPSSDEERSSTLSAGPSGFHSVSADIVDYYGDAFPAMFVALHHPRDAAATFNQRGSSATLVGGLNVAHVCGRLRDLRASDAISPTTLLVAPPTTCDGLRPRRMFGDEGRSAMPTMDRFAFAAQRIGVLHAAQLGILKEALFAIAAQETRRRRALALCAGGVCGRSTNGPRPASVVYMTNSMNPVENEAVVCAAISDVNAELLRLAAGGCEDARCVQFTTAPMGEVSGQLLEWLPRFCSEGLREWTSVDGCAESADCERYTAELREAVACASLRFGPAAAAVEDAGAARLNGSFVVRISVAASAAPLSGGRQMSAEMPTAAFDEAVAFEDRQIRVPSFDGSPHQHRNAWTSPRPPSTRFDGVDHVVTRAALRTWKLVDDLEAEMSNRPKAPRRGSHGLRFVALGTPLLRATVGSSLTTAAAAVAVLPAASLAAHCELRRQLPPQALAVPCASVSVSAAFVAVLSTPFTQRSLLRAAASLASMASDASRSTVGVAAEVASAFQGSDDHRLRAAHRLLRQLAADFHALAAAATQARDRPPNSSPLVLLCPTASASLNLADDALDLDPVVASEIDQCCFAFSLSSAPGEPTDVIFSLALNDDERVAALDALAFTSKQIGIADALFDKNGVVASQLRRASPSGLSSNEGNHRKRQWQQVPVDRHRRSGAPPAAHVVMMRSQARRLATLKRKAGGMVDALADEQHV